MNGDSVYRAIFGGTTVFLPLGAIRVTLIAPYDATVSIKLSKNALLWSVFSDSKPAPTGRFQHKHIPYAHLTFI